MNFSQVFPDIEPIPQNDGPHPVCAIDYPDKFVEAMNYLRALIDIDERSERALELSALCLRYNPANYTVWWYRRQCLSALSKQDDVDKNDDDNDGVTKDKDNKSTTTEDHNTDHDNDLSFTYYNFKRILLDLELASGLGGNNPKNYQIWYHRRSLLEYMFEMMKFNDNDDGDDDENNETLQVAKSELEYISNVLEVDAKNYHAWSHRQWILRTVNDATLWSNELEHLNYLIQKDVRNNSAWNQRWFATHKGCITKYPILSIKIAKSEADYAIQNTSLDPHNESPLRYLVALLKEQQKQQQLENVKEIHEGEDKDDDMTFISLINHVEEEVEKLKQTLNKGNDCPSLIAAYIDILEMKNDSVSLLKCVDMAKDLGTKFDIVRKKYWLMRTRRLQNNSSKLT